MASRNYAGLRYYTVEVEFDEDSDTNIIVVAETIEGATARARELFKEPSKPMLTTRDSDTWRNGRISGVEYSGEIDG